MALPIAPNQFQARVLTTDESETLSKGKQMHNIFQYNLMPKAQNWYKKSQFLLASHYLAAS
jgi:hypothetical protein